MTKQLIALCVLTLALCLAPAWSQAVPDGVQTVQFDVLLSPSHEVPALPDTDASGTATIEFILTRAGGNLVSAIADFHVNWRAGQLEEMRAAHIHRGAVGVNGGVVINTGLILQVPAESGAFFRQRTVTDIAGLAVIEEILADPSAFYFNVHSASHPAGIIRGQLRPDTAGQIRQAEANLKAGLAALDRLVRIVGGWGSRP